MLAYYALLCYIMSMMFSPQVDRMVLATIRKALSSLKSTAGRAETAQTPWLHRLNAASSRLSAEVSSVARLSKNLCDRLPKVHLIQAGVAIVLYLVNVPA